MLFAASQRWSKVCSRWSPVPFRFPKTSNLHAPARITPIAAVLGIFRIWIARKKPISSSRSSGPGKRAISRPGRLSRTTRRAWCASSVMARFVLSLSRCLHRARPCWIHGFISCLQSGCGPCLGRKAALPIQQGTERAEAWTTSRAPYATKSGTSYPAIRS